MWVQFLPGAWYISFVDPQIDELKELVRRNIELSTETNKIVHGIRNSARWASVARFLWWGLIVAASVASYVYFQPYIQKMEQIYNSVQAGGQQAQTVGNTFADFFKNLVPNQ